MPATREGSGIVERAIAIYLRLSLEDVDLKTNRSKDESNSVGNQRLLIKNHISRLGGLSLLPILEFCDDGYTGTNFERPQFQAMIDLVKDGKVSCVIVKDLSRFGRSYLEVGDYLEHIFPFLGVRFIAVNDKFDSDDYTGITSGIDIAFRNLIHQKYSEDLSCKVKSAMYMKMEKGKYVNHPPYGYMKSLTDKHRIIPDPKTAPIVREIFDAILAGHSTTQVAVTLNERQVLTPMAYKKWKERKELTGRLPIWNHRTILRIIRDLKYTGAMVNHKCENLHIRDKSQRRVPRSEWIIKEGMHEGIVTKEEFEVVGNAIRNVTKTERKAPAAWDRVFYCGHCGRKLRKSCNVNEYFACDTSVYQPDAKCGGYRWNKEDLEHVLLEIYKKQLLVMESRLKEVKAQKKKERPVDYVSHLRRIEREMESLNAEKLHRYEEYRGGQISKEGFLECKEKILGKAVCLHAEKADTQKQLTLFRQKKEENESMTAAFAAAAAAEGASDEELRGQMYEDVKRVFIFSNEDIKIEWKFADLFSEPISEALSKPLGHKYYRENETDDNGS